MSAIITVLRPRATLAGAMVARYEAELEQAPAVTDAQIAHRGIVEVLLEDWRARQQAVDEGSCGGDAA